MVIDYKYNYLYFTFYITGKTVSMTMDYSIEDDSTCSYDYLNLPYHGEVCGSQDNYQYDFTLDQDQDTFTVWFKTDGSVSYRGFEIQYSATGGMYYI